MPNADIFNNTPSYGGSFSVDAASLTFGGAAAAANLGALVQGVSGQYTRPLQRIFDLTPQHYTYYIVGRPEGQLTIQRLAAPGAVSTAFLSQFADICQVTTNTMSISTATSTLCSNQAVPSVPSTYTFSYCLMSGYQISIAVQQISMSEGIQIAFAGFSIGS